MFRAILYTQWKWCRLVILLATLAAFALPLMSVQGARGPVGYWETRQLLGAVQGWGVLYPVLATAIALIVAMVAWAPDHRGRHVYALSLPLPRWHYALLRFAAGATLLAAPVVAVWLGGILATSMAVIPAGLHAYPTMLAVRFGLAVLVVYSIFFAISAGTVRTAGYFLGALGLVVAFEAVANAAGAQIHPFEGMMMLLIVWPGPFDVLTGRWMLIDV